MPSCTAPFELLQQGTLPYIQFNDEVSSKG